MSVRAWAGFVGVGVVTMMFYAGVLPAWNVITEYGLAHGVDADYLLLLDKVLYWAPFVILIAAFVHAVTSPSFREQSTWRG